MGAQMVTMDIGFDLEQEQRQRNLPRLIEANYLLHLSSQELEGVISTELTSNPALEIDEQPACPICGTTLEAGSCPTCLHDTAVQPPQIVDEDNDRFESLPSQPASDDEFDAVSLIADGADALALLIADARAVLPVEDHQIIELLVNAIDERGFIDADLAEIARHCGRTKADVERVLLEIQELAPPGVGARNLGECLLLQIRFLREDGIDVPPLVETLAKDHLQALGSHRYHHLSRELRRSVEEISAAHDFIRSHLSPHPLQDSQARTWSQTARTPFVVPDVLITLDEVGDLHVEVVGHSQARLRVNDLYFDLAQQMRRRATQAASDDPLISGASDEDRHHIRDSVMRARQFISKLEQRRETLLRISVCICNMQKDFLT